VPILAELAAELRDHRTIDIVVLGEGAGLAGLKARAARDSAGCFPSALKKAFLILNHG